MAYRDFSMRELQEETVTRHQELLKNGASWDDEALALAAMGPVGYVGHLLTQQRRGFDIDSGELFDEIADAVIYLTLLCAELGGDIGEVVARKFNENSGEMKSPRTLGEK